MKVLICGSRHFKNEQPIRKVLKSLPPDTTVIHGTATGADSIAGRIAKELNLEVKEYPPDWKRYSYAAGPIRNTKMLREGKPDVVYAFITKDNNYSKGTQDLLIKAKRLGVKIQLISI